MTVEAGQLVEFRVLGPVEARRDGTPLHLGGPRQRVLLALLLLNPGRPVSAGRLIDELWAGVPPDGADVTVRSYISRLRTALGPEVPLVASIDGYALEVAPDAIDAVLFERLVRDAGAALVRRNTRRAREQLGAALDLWAGPPFAELGNDGALRAEADRLGELHVHAVEQRIDADLALGRSSELVDELEGLVRTHPFRESFWRQLMLALYRGERQADALGAYHRARAALDEQLGLEPGPELQALEGAILRQEVPPAALPEERNNLPALLTSFIGREAELNEVAQLLGAQRLVALTGVGGVGKTRVALEAARRALDDFVDGVYFIDLAPIAEPLHVATSVASVLDIREQPGGTLLDALSTQLRDRDMLLVFDNCEHLREATADLASVLLTGAPRLRILATSREALGVPGEVDKPISPLALSESDDPNAIRSSEAVQLFLERARAARPGIRDDDASLVTAWRICSALDGLPLAMELAAARARALSLEDIAARLNDRFRFLVSWRRLTSARHRTLREAMDWSFQLLGPGEQRLLARLSVFSGGFTLDVAAAICEAGDESAALDRLERLVEASLVTVDESADQTRYRLLETVRQYGAELLAASGESADLARRHAEHFAGLVESLYEPVRITPKVTEAWVRRLNGERDNIRSALRWGLDNADPNLQLRMAESLWFYWWVRGDLREGRSWIDSAVTAAVDAEPRLRARAMHGAAGLAWAHGDLDAARTLAESARAALAALGETHTQASATNTLGLIALHRGENDAAERLLQAADRLYRQADIPPRTRDLSVAIVNNNLGEISMAAGDYDAAEARYSEARTLNRAHGVDDSVNVLNLGIVAVQRGHHDEARVLLREALEAQAKVGFMQQAAACIEGIATLANRLGSARDAAVLLGGTGRIREDTGHAAFQWNARLRDQELAASRSALGKIAAAEAFDEGNGLSARDIIARARAFLDS